MAKRFVKQPLLLSEHVKVMLKRMASQQNRQWRSLAADELQRFLATGHVMPASMTTDAMLKVGVYIMMPTDLAKQLFDRTPERVSPHMFANAILEAYVEGWRRQMSYEVKGKAPPRLGTDKVQRSYSVSNDCAMKLRDFSASAQRKELQRYTAMAREIITIVRSQPALLKAKLDEWNYQPQAALMQLYGDPEFHGWISDTAKAHNKAPSHIIEAALRVVLDRPRTTTP